MYSLYGAVATNGRFVPDPPTLQYNNNSTYTITNYIDYLYYHASAPIWGTGATISGNTINFNPSNGQVDIYASPPKRGVNSTGVRIGNPPPPPSSPPTGGGGDPGSGTGDPGSGVIGPSDPCQDCPFCPGCNPYDIPPEGKGPAPAPTYTCSTVLFSAMSANCGCTSDGHNCGNLPCSGAPC